MADMCSAQHCSSVSAKINETCKKEEWPQNHLVLVCDPNTGDCCNCTCSCLAFNTPVAIGNDQNKAIQDFKVGDTVLAREKDQWVEKIVKFSDGTSPISVQPEMCYITCEIDGKQQALVTTMDHTLLTEENKLIQARQLRVGTKIQLASGGLTPVLKFDVRSYTGGVWNISTGIGEPSSLEGHLINTQGVVSGDYAVQLYYHDLVKQGKAVSVEEMPHFNSRKYDENLKKMAESTKIMSHGMMALHSSPAEVDLAHFLGAKEGSSMGLQSSSPGKGGVFLHLNYSHVLKMSQVGLKGFLTEKQADEVKEKLISDTIIDANILTRTNWLFTIFHAFYPDINFILDYPNRNANAYAMYLGDQKNIIIQGGLLRTDKLLWEGKALVLSYLVSRFNGGAPYGNDGLTCKPQADYAIVGVLTNVFYPLYPDVIYNSLNQVTELFNSLESKKDDPVTGCHSTTLDCRIETYKNAMQYDSLPACAGGKTNLLRVLNAQGQKDGSAVVNFSDFLNIEEASDVKNYQVEPEVRITKAEVSKTNDSVRIVGDFNVGIEYTVTVINVHSNLGSSLDPVANSATFTIPK
jgi:hypothetical protein